MTELDYILIEDTMANAGVSQSKRESIIAKIKDMLKPEPRPVCIVCGTPDNVYKDGWYGYRCQKRSCMVF